MLSKAAASVNKKLQRRKWTQAKLAQEVGVTQPTVSHWLDGSKEISLRYALKIKEILGVPVPDWTVPADAAAEEEEAAPGAA